MKSNLPTQIRTSKNSKVKASSDTSDTVPPADDMDKPTNQDDNDVDDEPVESSSDKKAINKGDLKDAMKEIEQEKSLAYHIEGRTKPELQKMHSMIKDKLDNWDDSKDNNSNNGLKSNPSTY